MFSAIVKIYGNNVINGRKTFEEVPSKIADDVKSYIISIKPNFFDVAEEETEEDESEETEESADSEKNLDTPVSPNKTDSGTSTVSNTEE